MEDKCFKEGCEEEASFLCKCISPHVKTCESHFFDHMTSNASRSHNPIVLKIRVDSNDSKEVIEILESHKNNIYNNIKKLTEVTKELHLCIEAEFVRQSNTLRGRLNEIQNLIEKLTTLQEFRNNRINANLYKLFSGDRARRNSYLRKYEELSNTLDLPNFRKKCHNIVDEINRLDQPSPPRQEVSSRHDEVHEFSDSSNLLITYNLLTMRKKETPLEGEFLGSKVKCVLPDGRLFCYKNPENTLFIFDPAERTVVDIDGPPCVFNSFINSKVFIYDGVVYFLGCEITDLRIYNQNLCLKFGLEPMDWGWSTSKGLDLLGFDIQGTTAAKFNNQIYATNNYSNQLYIYSEQGDLIRSYALEGEFGFKLLFVHKSKLYLLGRDPSDRLTNLLCMETGSEVFHWLNSFEFPSGLNPYCVKSIGDVVYFCFNDESFIKMNPEDLLDDCVCIEKSAFNSWTDFNYFADRSRELLEENKLNPLLWGLVLLLILYFPALLWIILIVVSIAIIINTYP